jgi:glycosyltransferase involved in cell wall biosynthesis
MKPILFSIILPTYNSEKTLARCLDSIVSQNFDSYELVVIDGKSNDSTLEIVREYSLKITNINVHSEPDLGIYDAMNKGIRQSNGKYLYFIGSDDFFCNSKILENVAKSTHNNSYDLIYGDVYNRSLNKIIGGLITEEKLLKHQVCHQSIFYNRNLFVLFGNYDIKMKVNADMYFNHIVFNHDNVRSKYLGLVITEYDGGGYSSFTFDVEYWRQAQKFFFHFYKNKVSNKIIYSNLLPIVKNRFSIRTLYLSIEALVLSANFLLLFSWLNHPVQYIKLFVRKKILCN